jgi:hypothetical protein
MATASHLGFLKNVDNFRINEAILIKFEQHTPDANYYRPF